MARQSSFVSVENDIISNISSTVLSKSINICFKFKFVLIVLFSSKLDFIKALFKWGIQNFNLEIIKIIIIGIVSLAPDKFGVLF